MALVDAYFSTTSAGTGDGSSWANRAALFSAGNWSTVITGFDFTSNSLRARVGPGNYTCAQSLASGIFTVAGPSVATPIILHGCDSSGNLLSPADPDWVSAQPMDDSAFPVIATSTNIRTINSAFCLLRAVKLTASGSNGPVIVACGAADWISVINSTANTSAAGISAFTKLTNSMVSMTSSSYAYAIQALNNEVAKNIRLVGVTGSSGNRRGVEYVGTTSISDLLEMTIIGFGGDAVFSTSTNIAQRFNLLRSVIANCSGNGVKPASTANQTQVHEIMGCMITGNGAYGIDAQSAARVLLAQSRLRNNTSGNLNGFGNYPTDLDINTSAGSDANEYVDSANGDYRIKNTSSLWGQGYGVADQPASGGGVVGDLTRSPYA